MWLIWLALIVTGGWYLLLLTTALFDKWMDKAEAAKREAERLHAQYWLNAPPELVDFRAKMAPKPERAKP